MKVPLLKYHSLKTMVLFLGLQAFVHSKKGRAKNTNSNTA